MLSETLRTAASRFGDRTAWVSPTGWSVSYATADRIVNRVAAAMTNLGLRRGDVLAVVLPPSPEYFLTYLGAARIGVITAGINHRLTAAERGQLLEVADPSAVICTAGFEPIPAGRSSAQPTTIQIEIAAHEDSAFGGLFELAEQGTKAEYREVPYDPARALAIVFTSGTSGTPRGAVFCGHQLEFITEVDTGGSSSAGTAEENHALSGMSLTHLGPMTKLPGTMMRATTTHMLNRWSPTAALELTQKYAMKALAGIPTQIALMLHHKDFDHYDLSSVQVVVMGGGPSTEALHQEIRETLGVPVMIRYSCTEAGVGVGAVLPTKQPVAAPQDQPSVGQLVGSAHPGVQVTIRDDAGDIVTSGAPGEVCISSPAVMTAYWRDTAATDAAFTKDGAVRTGDVGYMAEDGLTLVGRSKDMYVRGGYNIYPAEVEAVLLGHPAVAQVAVIPIPDSLMGEIGVAAVVRSGEASGAELTLGNLRNHASSTLTKHKLPEGLMYVDELPLTAMEKLDRRHLQQIVMRSDSQIERL